MPPAPREQPHELRDAAFKHSITATHQLAALESENMKLRESLSSETVPTPASPAATPRTDRFALEKMFQASAGVLTEDDAIEQLLNFARTLERENADLQMRLARKAEQAADLESQCANLRRDLEQADSVCDAALRSLPSATAAISAPVEEGAIWNEAIEAAAKQIEPGYQRGCDCEFCDCGNRGDAQRVATWDSDTIGAAMIRKLKRHDMKREQS